MRIEFKFNGDTEVRIFPENNREIELIKLACKQGPNIVASIASDASLVFRIASEKKSNEEPTK